MGRWLLLFIFVTLPSWAQLEITPMAAGKTVFPGDVAEAKIQILDESLVNKIKPTQLRKLGDPQLFLFMALSPIQKDASGWHMQAKLVLGPNFSPDSVYPLTLGSETFEVRFRGWLWNPQTQQVTPDYDYEDVPLFSRTWLQKNRFKVIGLVFAILGMVIFFGLRWRRKLQTQKRHADEVRKWLRKIEEANTLQDLSAIWASRDELDRIFPSSQPEFRKFFDGLNEHQFKPSISSDDLKVLLGKKAHLLSQVRGGQGGA